MENEYKGSDLEGNSLIFWLGPANDFCLPYGKFEALGVYFVGYIAFDGLTYALTEVSGPNYKIQVTAIENENYNFDATGYSYKK